MPTAAHISTPPSLPLVGRRAELTALYSAIDAASTGDGRTMILAGEGGIGKTRLASAVVQEVERRGWASAVGRAYPVETGVPYAPFSDALLPLLRSLEPTEITVLTRGSEEELAFFFPALGRQEGRTMAMGHGSPAEFKTRLLWNFAQFLSRLAARRPLLLVLENLQWADASSLELLHFTARQIVTEPILLLCTYNEAERSANPLLGITEQSLLSVGAAQLCRLGPLSRADTHELVRSTFGASETAVGEFAELLYERTQGNPFFIEETLKALVDSGRLYQREGTWLGWEVERLELPQSVREVTAARLSRLSPAARGVADLAATLGTRAEYEVLRAVSPLAETELVSALDELRRQHVLVEQVEGGAVVYDFNHPMLQDVLYRELGAARARLLHASVAEAMEAFYGARALEHADELAYHFRRAHVEKLAPKVIQYLAAAGRSALARYANREAADYLSAALEQARQHGDFGLPAERIRLVVDLARARQRLGDYESAIRLWDEAAAAADAADDPARLAAIRRQMGLALYWSGRHLEALEQYRLGYAAAQRADDDALRAQLQLARGISLQELGRAEEARAEVEAALEVAERLADPVLLARVHRALLLIHAWTGPFDKAREHGSRAIELAEQVGERGVACSAHWTMGMIEGFTEGSAGVMHHIAEAQRLSEELHSPVHRLWTAEMSIELASATGEWEEGIAIAERTIALARRLGQKALLPRLLVWSGLILLWRGDLERSRKQFEEAWELAGCGEAEDNADHPLDVHAAVPAHAGMAAYHLATGNFAEARRIGEAGLAIADRSGYVIWSIHRLIPIIGESYLWMRDLEGAERLARRLEHDAERFGHNLARAWAVAGEGLVAHLRDEQVRAAQLLRQAIEEMEAIPMVLEAARLRFRLALGLVQLGDREAAVHELRRAHESFARLGAENELDATREQLRLLGARPPTRSTAGGIGALTGRELEIIRFVAERKSNKAIGKALSISPRTVGTHLSNIYQKVGVGSRGELADFAREEGLLDGVG